jgi:hypothetical protein
MTTAKPATITQPIMPGSNKNRNARESEGTIATLLCNRIIFLAMMDKLTMSDVTLSVVSEPLIYPGNES